jgi:acetyl esterase/lipase
MLIKLLMLGVFAVVGAAASGQMPAAETMPLWKSDAPGALGHNPEDIPTITLFRPAPGKETGAAIVVCPGGGYQGLADYEGKPIAEWAAAQGILGIVLKYRLAPHYHHPSMLLDVSRAIRTARANAAAWHLDPERIGVLGFSAGGHLASTAATHFDDGDPSAADPIDRVSSRPNAAILIYAVISMNDPYTHGGSRTNLLGEHPTQEMIDLLSGEKQVTRRTPPSFIVCSNEDTAVPAENSILFALACRKAGVPVELHMYEKGPHGFAMGQGDESLATWPPLCSKWLRRRHFLP